MPELVLWCFLGGMAGAMLPILLMPSNVKDRIFGVKMDLRDMVIGALCAWRENRGGGKQGMQSVINVLCNRAKQKGTSVYMEAIRPYQFSSMTAKGDPQLDLFPKGDDEAYQDAFDMMLKADKGELADLTGGATFYYANSMPKPPSWASQMVFTVEIENQKFFRV